MSSSLKLSITLRGALAAKYDTGALAAIDKAVEAWKAADAKRGIATVHVALDDAKALQPLGVPALKGRATAVKVKRALDALCKRLHPDYVVILGGHEIVPMFVVPNPSYDPQGDDDRDVPTDNPYACSAAFRAKQRKSYLVPDRVLGRIPDLTADGDPAWLVDYLERCTAWQGRPRSFYAKAYAVVCDEWKKAGEACMGWLGLPTGDLQVSPPALDNDATAKTRLRRTLHMVKCHGASLDPRFYGQKKTSYPEILRSSTLQGRLVPGTLAAAMCCYGAQVYSPADPAAQVPGAPPIANTYLRRGAVGFAGSTRIAWVGVDQMMCADWIAASYLKAVLGGASIGRAFLEAKQDYVKWLAQQGQAPDTADEKTLVEYVLLGDPAMHPVADAAVALSPSAKGAKAARAGAAPAAAARPSPLLAQERAQRRAVRAAMGAQIRAELPQREHVERPAPQHAERLFAAVARIVGKGETRGLDPARAQAQRLVSPLVAANGAAGANGSAVASVRHAVGAAPRQAARESIEYYWSGRVAPARGSGGLPQIRLLKVETDREGQIVRTRLLHGA